MLAPPAPLFRRCLLAVFLLTLCAPPVAHATESSAKVYVILWFDTEDYILPASDDAALKVADFLTKEKIRATFKVVGEKARTLEKRKRDDVIAALKKHEIGYHSNYHSVQPSPAMYLNNLGWDDGVAEFDRREKPGRDDVERIFGVAPSCYGQPGSSWGPQSYGAMRKWGMQVYLDAGSHVGLDDKPYYYCGILNLYKLAHTLRADLNDRKKLEEAEERFVAARKALLAEGGGVVSIYYHPCEFVHKEFWDGVNFRKGANPPRHQWKLPPAKTEEESKVSYQVFEDYIRFIERFPEVRFITASEAAKLYRDKALDRKYTKDEIRAVAAAAQENASFQRREGYALAPSEILFLLNRYLVERGAGKDAPEISWKNTPLGPSSASQPLAESVSIDWNQVTRTAADVDDAMTKQDRVPGTIWLGSVGVPPEVYLRSLARVVLDVLDGKDPPKMVEFAPAKLVVTKYVADDDPKLWGWVIFPPGFHAPALMELAKRQAWTLKPALLDKSRE
jgi:hypothetical protein